MKRVPKTKVTLEKISRQLESGFESAQKHTDTQIEELARMTQNGFSELKSDLKATLLSKKDFTEFQTVVLDQFRLLNAEVKSINTTLGPTVVIVAEQERRIQTLESRLERVEHKVGIVHMK